MYLLVLNNSTKIKQHFNKL